MNWEKVLTFVIPPLSVLAGAALNEFFHSQRERSNLYLKDGLARKVELYEQLYNIMYDLRYECAALFRKVHTKGITNTEKTEMVQEFGENALRLYEFTDKHVLFLDADCVDHILVTFMAPADIAEMDVDDKDYLKELNKLKKKFYLDYHEGVDLIQEYSGLNRVNSSLLKANKPKNESKYVWYMKEAAKKYGSKKEQRNVEG